MEKSRTKKDIKTQLRADGWRNVPQSDIWVNTSGETYNARTSRKSNAPTVQTTAGRLRVEKAILWAFAGETPRSGQIVHKNGNKADKRPENLKYKTPSHFAKAEKVNNADLLTALRCYFQLEPKSTPRYSDGITKVYVKMIVEIRGFSAKNESKPFYSVFTDYLEYTPTTTAKIAETQNIPLKTAQTVVARFTNMLTSEVLADLESGRLTILPYQPTRRELRKRETALLREMGIKRPQRFIQTL